MLLLDFGGVASGKIIKILFIVLWLIFFSMDMFSKTLKLIY